jgi:hypothetical protein
LEFLAKILGSVMVEEKGTEDYCNAMVRST